MSGVSSSFESNELISGLLAYDMFYSVIVEDHIMVIFHGLMASQILTLRC